MARTYWTRGATTAAQEDSLHAHMAQRLLLDNANAIYEVGSYDVVTVPPSLVQPGADTGWVLIDGPLWLPVHYDRDSHLRVMGFQLCACGGAAARDFAVVLTETYREPDIDGASPDPQASFQGAAVAVPVWIAEQQVGFPDTYSGLWPRLWLDGEEPVRVQGLWASVWVDTPNATTGYLGLRSREVVAV